jgi:hypothetical protein
MRVQFDYDIDDVVDSSARMLFGSPAGQRRLQAMRSSSAAYSGFLVGMAVLAFAPGPLEAKMGLAVILGFAAAVVQWINYPRAVRRAWRRQYLGLLGSEGPFTCEVELRPDGVWARQNQAQVLYEWPSVVSIEDTADSIDFRTRSGGYLVVRDRAFWSADERQKFLTTARRCREMYPEADETSP